MERKTKKIAALMLGTALAVTPALAMASEYATVKGGGLNLRQSASLSAKVLGQYRTGTWIEVIQSGDTWSKVNVNGKSGYMMSKYLNLASSGKTYYVRTNTGIGLNLRAAPSSGAEIITSYPINTKVTLLQRGSNWSHVSVEGKEGYMSNNFLASYQAPSYTTPVANPYSATLININGGKIVNFRLYPGMNTKVLKTLPVGTTVTVLEKGVNWCKVDANGETGYVSTYFLKTK